MKNMIVAATLFTTLAGGMGDLAVAADAPEAETVLCPLPTTFLKPGGPKKEENFVSRFKGVVKSENGLLKAEFCYSALHMFMNPAKPESYTLTLAETDTRLTDEAKSHRDFLQLDEYFKGYTALKSETLKQSVRKAEWMF